MDVITGDKTHLYAPSVATIGFFDGVHQGHRFLLEQVKEVAAMQGLCSTVITFPAHPRQVLQPAYCPLLLSSPQEKLRLLEQAGVDHCILLPFTKELSLMTAREFMHMLRKDFNVTTLIIGYDHRFGHNRAESFEDYQRYGEELDIHIMQADAYTQGEDHISSSAVRKALQAGDVECAATYLGYLYSLNGTVTDGYKVGRRIGFPTANLSVEHPGKLIPLDGVYAVNVHVKGKKHLGMLNIGHRPTLNNGSNQSIEVHIIDFSEDIYREPMRIEFMHFIRPEIKFNSVEELVAQIRKDAESVINSCSKERVF